MISGRFNYTTQSIFKRLLSNEKGGATKTQIKRVYDSHQRSCEKIN